MEEHQGNDVTIDDFISDQNEEISEVAEFYAGKTLFVTGSSGFMGSVLVEKLLRSCPDVDKVYVLLRPKKGKSTEERLKAQYDGELFDLLRSQRPGFYLKVEALEGDCTQPKLGLSDESLEKLKEVNIVFHVAATVRFDEHMRIATAINVRSTIDLLHLARTMPELKAFVHVSTAYSYPKNKVIEEKFYAPDVEPDRLLNIVNSMDDAMLESITPQLITSWPNTYAFTKAVAEDAVKRYSKGLPLIMVRPSMVISTAKEPVAGWINNVYGPTGVVTGAGVGLIHVLNADSSSLADMVPVDMAINSIIVAAWDVAQSKEENQETSSEEPDPPVLNLVSSVDQPITWGEFMALNARGVAIPSMRCVWYYDFRLTKNRYLYLFQKALMHLLPALIVDTAVRVVGKKPFLWEAYKKIHKFSKVITYFCTRDWQFTNNNVNILWKKLNSKDRSVYDFHFASLRWDEYFRTYMRGLRVYLLKDPLDTLEESKVRYRKLKALNYALYGLLYFSLVWLLLKLVRWLVW